MRLTHLWVGPGTWSPLSLGTLKMYVGVELEFNPQGFNFLKIPGVGV